MTAATAVGMGVIVVVVDGVDCLVVVVVVI